MFFQKDIKIMWGKTSFQMLFWLTIYTMLCYPNGFRFESPCIYLYLKVMRISSEREQNEFNSIGAACD